MVRLLTAAGLAALLSTASVACSSAAAHRPSHQGSVTGTTIAAPPSLSAPPTPPPLAVTRTLTVSAPAGFLRFALGSVWAVTNPGAVLRLSMGGQQVGQPVRTGALDVKFDQGHMYVLTDTAVEEIDPVTARVQTSRPVGYAISFDVLDGVAYVATSSTSSTVEAINMATGHTRTTVLPAQLSDSEHADSIAVTTGGAVWVIAGETLLDLNASTLAVTGRYSLSIPGTTLRVTAAGVFVGTQNSGGGIVRLAPGAASVRPCWATGDALQIAVQGSHLWASAAAGLTEIDQQTCAVLGQAPGPDEGGTGVAVLPGEIWCSYPDLNQIQIVDTH